MVYGMTGTIRFDELAPLLAQDGLGNVVLVFGLVFIVVGLAFKLGAVPFHMWVPDVYHGAPTAVTLFLGSAPKIAAFALAMRMLVDGMQPLLGNGGWDGWQGMLIVLAVLSMAIGNLIAIAQTNIKRMLAYSTISHVGFILLGILAGTQEGYTAAMFYTLVYALMSAGGFGIVIALSRRGFEADNLDDYKGLNQRNPWFAGMMLLLMFSMAGVPPTVGLLRQAVRVGCSDLGGSRVGRPGGCVLLHHRRLLLHPDHQTDVFRQADRRVSVDHRYRHPGGALAERPVDAGAGPVPRRPAVGL